VLMSSALRKVPFGSDYWHVVSDEHESIIGSLLYTPGRTLLPWRAEFTGAGQCSGMTPERPLAVDARWGLAATTSDTEPDRLATTADSEDQRNTS
jgi:hypothetical protein